MLAEEKDSRIGQGFTTATEETLLVIRQNLLKGLDKVAEHVDKGTLHVVAAGRASSPGEAGQITLGLLRQIDKELDSRG